MKIILVTFFSGYFIFVLIATLLAFKLMPAWYKFKVIHIGYLMLTSGVLCGYFGKLGFAGVLSAALIKDTLIYYITGYLSTLSGGMAVIMMFLANCLINFFIGSASLQAATVMPIMAPLANTVPGITQHLTVLTYQLGDGFTNLLNLASALLLGSLGIAGVKFKEWLKFLFPLYTVFFIVISITLLIATVMGWNPGLL